MGTKSFYHTIPNSVIHVMRGPAYCEALCFHNGRLDIDEEDKDALEMLEAIADRPGSPVSAKGRPVDTAAKEAARAVQENAAHVVSQLAQAKPGQV